MTDCTDDCDLARLCSQRHWAIYWLVILGSMIFVAGKIFSIGIGDPETPFMSANDRSRWATIQALGDHNTYEIDDVIVGSDDGILRNTIDKVQHLGSDGRLHFYSSKPPLLPTLLGYLYRGIKLTTGLSLSESPVQTVRWMLLLFNGGCWFLTLWLLASTLERIPARDWTRYFIVAAAGFATFLSTFAVTLSNHLPAAAATMLVLYCLVRIVNRDGSMIWYALAGLAAGGAVANELPALSLAGLAGVICIYKSVQKGLFGFVPGFALVLVAFLAANYSAHNDWRPPYAHRGDGEKVGEVSVGEESSLNAGSASKAVASELNEHGLSEIRTVRRANWPDREGVKLQRWVVSDFEDQRLTLVMREGETSIDVHAWDNWYDFQGSYWTKKRSGKKGASIDDGQTDAALNCFHMIFGHHGIVSLTPIWLLAFGGMVTLLFQAKFQLRWLAALVIIVTAVVLSFYIFGVSPMDRNYGGQTSAFRWALWMAPLWLIAMVPVVDWLSLRTSGRALCLILLGISAISALYSAENPWVHPWLYEIWDTTGLPK